VEPTADRITVLDVTLRDGGYVNGHSWSRRDAATVVEACAAAHVSYCEVGYFRPHREGPVDRWPAASCPPDYLRELSVLSGGMTLGVMAHARDVELADFARLAALGVGLVRLPAQAALLPKLAGHVEAAKAAGLLVSVNLIRVSEVATRDVSAAAASAARFGADVFYLADSNGSLFPDEVAERIRAAADGTDIALGFHAHDGLSLAFINSLAATEAGCSYLDASLGGLGKGGGNLALELVVGYLRKRGETGLSMAPLVPAAATVIEPWRGGVTARSESIATGLLDLNLDNIEALRGGSPAGLFELVDALPG
jgi:4-hydroxy 2-oxovalerate aldolase